MTSWIGKPFPKFSKKGVVFGELENVESEKFLGRYVIFFFYPADFAYVCTAELLSFENRLDEFSIIDCAFVGISCDSVLVHRKWTETPVDRGGLGPIRFPLLWDSTGELSRRVGVWNASSGCASRGSFIVDAAGIVRHVAIFDVAVGRNVTEHLRIVKALKFSDKFQAECLLDWRPNSLRGGGGGEGGEGSGEGEGSGGSSERGGGKGERGGKGEIGGTKKSNSTLRPGLSNASVASRKADGKASSIDEESSVDDGDDIDEDNYDEKDNDEDDNEEDDDQDGNDDDDY